MTDVFTVEKRSAVMAKIKSKHNKETELLLISIFKNSGIKGWRRNYKVFGRPDFVFLNHKLALFVDGCFWHQCPDHSKIPKQNNLFWSRKLKSNVERDKLVSNELTRRGWKVLRIWEHELKDSVAVVARILNVQNGYG